MTNVTSWRITEKSVRTIDTEDVGTARNNGNVLSKIEGGEKSKMNGGEKKSQRREKDQFVSA